MAMSWTRPRLMTTTSPTTFPALCNICTLTFFFFKKKAMERWSALKLNMSGEKHSHVQTVIPLHITRFNGSIKKRYVIELLWLLHFLRGKNGWQQVWNVHKYKYHYIQIRFWSLINYSTQWFLKWLLFPACDCRMSSLLKGYLLAVSFHPLLMWANNASKSL